jgi:GAF domain-containing protein
MLTSLDERESITRCIEAGAWDHVPKPFDPVILRARLGSALERKASRDKERRYLAQIVAEKKRADDLLHGVIPIGVALTRERDEATLLARILDEARRFCGAEGGAIWLCMRDDLELVRIQVEPLGIAGPPEPRDAVTLRLGEESRQSPAVQAVLTGRPVVIRDVSHAGDYDVSHVRAFDERHAYHTRSLLSLPLRRDDQTLGVLELWNATRANDDEVVGFAPASVEVLASLSMLAAVALDAERREHDLRQRIRRLEISVDASKRERQVSAITETDYFQQLREKARELRKGAR